MLRAWPIIWTRTRRYEICGLTLVMMYSFVGGFMLGMLLALISFTAKYTGTPIVKSILNGAFPYNP